MNSNPNLTRRYNGNYRGEENGRKFEFRPVWLLTEWFGLFKRVWRV